MNNPHEGYNGPLQCSCDWCNEQRRITAAAVVSIQGSINAIRSFPKAQSCQDAIDRTARTLKRKISFDELDKKFSQDAPNDYGLLPEVTPAEYAESVGWDLQDYYNEMKKKFDEYERINNAW